jgi:hypothetical protein
LTSYYIFAPSANLSSPPPPFYIFSALVGAAGFPFHVGLESFSVARLGSARLSFSNFLLFSAILTSAAAEFLDNSEALL